MSSGTWQRRLLDALEEFDHPMTCAAWAEMLARHGGEEYADRPPPGRPAFVLSRAARLAVMAARVRAGKSPCHPRDLWRKMPALLKVGVQAEHNRRNGADQDGPLVVLGRSDPLAH